MLFGYAFFTTAASGGGENDPERKQTPAIRKRKNRNWKNGNRKKEGKTCPERKV
jgi:hypothetical protein